jgi:hypothetical protein
VLQHLKEIKLSFSKRKEEKDTKREMVTDSFLQIVIEDYCSRC